MMTLLRNTIHVIQANIDVHFKSIVDIVFILTDICVDL